MKRLIVFAAFASLVFSVSAQTTRYDVNVYSSPFRGVEWTPVMGETYQRMMQMYQESDRNRIERERLQLEREQMEYNRMMESARISAAANAEGQKIVSDEVKTFNGTNLATKTVTPIRARIVKRKNGSIAISCLGIKIGETWKSCEKSISSLQEMYEAAQNESERSMALSLMDLGNYLLDTGTEIYIIK